ncbi:hypothetical protein [Salipiger bermudensis]|uniref:hypothetical protein n=1 Tax=Salipiger bermudensis TaxID=344736 RepID=UPI001CD5EB7D|nr:hypothetical protein [Salipiger bermudensis]MCA0964979.1 hypothetical protein [Salipiger bermudensis]
MQYTDITSRIAQLPHVTNVKWHGGCVFIFVDFVPENAGDDPAPFPVLDHAVTAELAAVSDDEPRYIARGYVDPDRRLFGVSHLSGTSMEEVRASFENAISS